MMLCTHANGPDWHKRVLVAVDPLSTLGGPRHCDHLLKMYAKFVELCADPDFGSSVYCIEVFDVTPEFFFGRSCEEDPFDEDKGSGLSQWISATPRLKKDNSEHPSPQSVTAVIAKEGVHWSWYEKHCDDLFTTPVLPWAVLQEAAGTAHAALEGA